MCLRVNRKFINRKKALEYKNNPPVADTDIVVYKILRKIHNIDTNRVSYVSPHRGEPYVPGRLKKVKSFSFTFKDSHTINNNMYKRILVNRGLHAFTTLREANDHLTHHSEVIVKCIIPEGTPYFTDNESNEIVTLKLSMPNKF